MERCWSPAEQARLEIV